MTIKIKLDEGAKMPTRAHSTDAGLDIYSREDTERGDNGFGSSGR